MGKPGRYHALMVSGFPKSLTPTHSIYFSHMLSYMGASRADPSNCASKRQEGYQNPAHKVKNNDGHSNLKAMEAALAARGVCYLTPHPLVGWAKMLAWSPRNRLSGTMDLTNLK